jgi:hypothetical protein
MNLDEILASLEKKASDASEEMKEGKKEEKKEEKEQTKKDEAAEGSKVTVDQEKSAAFKAGEDLAKEILEKVASQNTHKSNKGEDMNKQASEAGKALAQALLKKAGVGDVSTDNGIPAGVVPNKTQVDLAAQKAEHDMVIQPLPGTDGAGNGGTINQIFDAIVADAFARTNAKDEQESGNTAKAEGAVNANQAPNQVPIEGPGAIGGESQEKTAALIALVNDGVDFDQAVNLIKAAEEELIKEHDAQVKAAALNELLNSGVDFDKAVAMVKSAGAKQTIEQEKRAALNALIGEGVDFDTAVELVNAKAQEIYGK